MIRASSEYRFYVMYKAFAAALLIATPFIVLGVQHIAPSHRIEPETQAVAPVADGPMAHPPARTAPPRLSSAPPLDPPPPRGD